MDVLIDGVRYRGGVGYGVATDYTTLAPGRHTMQIVYTKSLKPVVITQTPAVVVPTAPETTVENTAVENSTSTDAATETTTRTTTRTTTQTTAPPLQTMVKPKERVTLTQQLDLVAGKVYSVVVFHDAATLPKLRLLEDKFASELPRASTAGGAANGPASAR